MITKESWIQSQVSMEPACINPSWEPDETGTITFIKVSSLFKVFLQNLRRCVRRADGGDELPGHLPRHQEHEDAAPRGHRGGLHHIIRRLRLRVCSAAIWQSYALLNSILPCRSEHENPGIARVGSRRQYQRMIHESFQFMMRWTRWTDINYMNISFREICQKLHLLWSKSNTRSGRRFSQPRIPWRKGVRMDVVVGHKIDTLVVLKTWNICTVPLGSQLGDKELKIVKSFSNLFHKYYNNRALK